MRLDEAIISRAEQVLAQSVRLLQVKADQRSVMASAIFHYHGLLRFAGRFVVRENPFEDTPALSEAIAHIADGVLPSSPEEDELVAFAIMLLGNYSLQFFHEAGEEMEDLVLVSEEQAEQDEEGTSMA